MTFASRIMTMLILTAWMTCIGCSTFSPLGDRSSLRDVDPTVQRLEIVVPDGSRFLFPKNQYRIEIAEGSGAKVVGWGEQYGPFGLMNRNFFSVTVSEGSLIRIEEIDVTRSVLFGGLLSGVGIVTYLGIRALSTSGSENPGDSNPPDVN